MHSIISTNFFSPSTPLPALLSHGYISWLTVLLLCRFVRTHTSVVILIYITCWQEDHTLLHSAPGAPQLLYLHECLLRCDCWLLCLQVRRSGAVWHCSYSLNTSIYSTPSINVHSTAVITVFCFIFRYSKMNCLLLSP